MCARVSECVCESVRGGYEELSQAPCGLVGIEERVCVCVCVCDCVCVCVTVCVAGAASVPLLLLPAAG